jgi:hypothetical protein
VRDPSATVREIATAGRLTALGVPPVTVTGRLIAASARLIDAGQRLIASGECLLVVSTSAAAMHSCCPALFPLLAATG